jgi:hypothetical protein
VLTVPEEKLSMPIKSTKHTRLLALTLSLALALAQTVVAPVSAAGPKACRVKNLDTGIVKASLQLAHNAATNGHRLVLRGTCTGSTKLRKRITVTGVRTATSGAPTLDGKGRGTVVTVGGPNVRPRRVTMSSLVIKGGMGVGIMNRNPLVLRDVVVRDNAGDGGGGVYNSGRLTLNGSSSITRNTAAAGGGVYNILGLLIMNGASSISGNSAEADGGGVYNFAAEIRLNGSSSITKNMAASGGGAWSYSDVIIGGICGGSGNIRNNTPNDCYDAPIEWDRRSGRMAD